MKVDKWYRIVDYIGWNDKKMDMFENFNFFFEVFLWCVLYYLDLGWVRKYLVIY